MKKKPSFLQGKYWVMLLAVIVISIAFSFVTISSTHRLNRNLNLSSTHIYGVSSNIYKMQSLISDTRIYTTRMKNSNEKVDTKYISEQFEEIRKEIKNHCAYVEKYYMGPHKDLEDLEKNLNSFMSDTERYIQDAQGQRSEQSTKVIHQSLLADYEKLDESTNTILEYTEQMITTLSRSSSSVLFYTIIFTVILAIFLIFFAFLYQREMLQRVKQKDVYYRDFLFKILAENVDNVFMIYNLAQHRMEFLSPNAEQVLGVDHQTLEFHAEDLPLGDSEVLIELNQEIQSEKVGQRIEKECTVLNPKTKEEQCLSICIYVVKEKDVVSRYVISITDLTELKKNQRVLNDALINAQNANQAKTQFLSRMSHEIRTPMNAIIGMTTIAASAIHSPEWMENCLTKISASSKHLLMLINDILDMSKIESGKMALSQEVFYLTDLLDNLSTMVYIQTEAKHQLFDVSVDVIHEHLMGDPLRLNQILLNVLSNSVKFTPEEGYVKLVVKEIGSKKKNFTRMRFTITDNGIGMNKEFIDKMFMPFEQEHSGTGGTGLGMAITKNLVMLASGSIAVESEQGNGSKFVVEIPFEIVENKESKREEIEQKLDHLKVLVADDDLDTCEHTSIILRRMGIDVDWVLSGEQAVEKVLKAFRETESYDVVFIDWKMPKVDGIEATRRIRKLVGPETLIIIITAFDWTEIEEEARIAGANAFISKPMFQSTIYNTLIKVMQEQSGGSHTMSHYQGEVKADFTGKRFLLVEDNPLNAEITIELLRMTCAEIEHATNGKEALEKFVLSDSRYYDAILMDVQMPTMNGYEATKAIRNSNHRDANSIPIIAMTANAFSEDVSASLQAGMNAHIAKPIDYNVLYKTLIKLLNDEKV